MGWWTADIKNQLFICSPFLIRLLDLREDGIISFDDFNNRMQNDFRLNMSILSDTEQIEDEYVFLMHTTRGNAWMRSKACYNETDENGNLYMHGFTEFRKEEDDPSADKVLQRSDRIIQNLYQNFPVGVELYDKDGYLIDLNKKNLEIFHLTDKKEVLGVNLFENPNLTDEMKEKIRKHEAVTLNIQYDYSKIGEYYSAEQRQGYMTLMTKITTLYDAYNNPINYLLINVDKTEDAIAYEKIREFEDAFALVGNYAKVGYAQFNILTKEGYAQSSWYWNVGEKDNTPMNQIVGVNAHFHPEDRARIFEFMSQVKQGLASRLTIEVRILRDSGEQTWTCINLHLKTYEPQNNCIELICVNYDITALKESEQNLLRAKERAEESDRLKSSFLANMSHEIRTPLNSIVGFSSMLQETTDQGEKQEYIKIIEENNRLLLQLISDILDLSKIEAGRYDMTPVDINAGQLCTDLVNTSVRRVSNGVKLQLADSLPQLNFVSDKNRVQQVLLNFVNNAIKFTNEGSITLGYEVQNNCVKFYVQDTGIGIAPHMQKEVFNRFVKLNTFIPGTGLGLPICQTIITQMGGNIGVDSVPGQGSCFWFTHPLN